MATLLEMWTLRMMVMMIDMMLWIWTTNRREIRTFGLEYRSSLDLS
jgi:hypothetical protein